MYRALLLYKSCVAEHLPREWKICIQLFPLPEKVQTRIFDSSEVASEAQAGPSGVLVMSEGCPLGTNVKVYLISQSG